MTCGNPIKHKLQKVVDNWIDSFSVERKLSDEQMECMQFGICDYVPRQVEGVHFFSFLKIAGKSKALVPFHEIYKQLSFDHRKINKYEEISVLMQKLQELGHGSVIKGPIEGKCLKA